MTLENLDGIKVFIIESLRNGDKRTGEDLKDNLRQIWYDQNLIPDFDCQYTHVHDTNDLICTIKDGKLARLFQFQFVSRLSK